MILKNRVLEPQWPAPAQIRSAFTTRDGGVSAAPFDSLNLGDHVHDNPAHVAQNRAVLQQVISIKPVFLKQVHGMDVAALHAGTADGTQADACITQARGVACTIMVADCLPLLITDRAGSFVAAAHAGWRGLVGAQRHGVLEAVFKAILALQPVEPAQSAIKLRADELLVWLGPCIGPAQFEVGAEVKAAFEASQAGAARHFKKLARTDKDVGTGNAPDKYFADLPALARDRLHALGITQIYGNDGSDAWCTASNPSRFFSHRRDAARLGSTGRMAACIWLADAS
jgi:polyphenol oxidase